MGRRRIEDEEEFDSDDSDSEIDDSDEQDTDDESGSEDGLEEQGRQQKQQQQQMEEGSKQEQATKAGSRSSAQQQHQHAVGVTAVEAVSAMGKVHTHTPRAAVPNKTATKPKRVSQPASALLRSPTKQGVAHKTGAPPIASRADPRSNAKVRREEDATPQQPHQKQARGASSTGTGSGRRLGTEKTVQPAHLPRRTKATRSLEPQLNAATAAADGKSRQVADVSAKRRPVHDKLAAATQPTKRPKKTEHTAARRQDAGRSAAAVRAEKQQQQQQQQYTTPQGEQHQHQQEEEQEEVDEALLEDEFDRSDDSLSSAHGGVSDMDVSSDTRSVFPSSDDFHGCGYPLDVEVDSCDAAGTKESEEEEQPTEHGFLALIPCRLQALIKRTTAVFQRNFFVHKVLAPKLTFSAKFGNIII